MYARRSTAQAAGSVMRVQHFTIGLLAALSMASATAADGSPVVVARHHVVVARHHSACLHAFSLHRGLVYARHIYAGTRRTKVREMKRLGVMERCQRSAHGRRYLHRRAHALRMAHRHRRTAAASWNSSGVSWYDDSGTTASGWHATYGVADCGTDGVCYPFGTRIEFCYNGCVVATVDDHGPYVAGRDFDLGASTASATGVDAAGVATVRWRVIR